MGKILILIKDDDFSIGEVRLFAVKDMPEAKYWFSRKIEKEGWEADRAFLVDSSNELPVEKWAEEYREKVEHCLKEQREREERATFERLKKKFEP